MRASRYAAAAGPALGVEAFLGVALPTTGAWLDRQPRMLSILRIVVGLLYMEHGLNKLSIFRRRRPMRPITWPASFRVSPGHSKWWAVSWLPSVSSPGRRPLSCRGRWPWPISWRMRRRTFFRCLTAATPQSSIASYSCIFLWRRLESRPAADRRVLSLGRVRLQRSGLGHGAFCWLQMSKNGA